MLTKYLEEKKKTLSNQKADLDIQLKNVDLKLKENEKMASYLYGNQFQQEDLFVKQAYHDFDGNQLNALKQEKEELIHEKSEVLRKIDNVSRETFQLNDALKELVSLRSSNNLSSGKKDFYDLKMDLLKNLELDKKRIASDLHDTSVQDLTAITYKIQIINQLLEDDPIRCRLELETMNQTLKKTINDLRNVIYDLRPMTFDDIGIEVAIESEIERLNKLYNSKILFGYYGTSTNIDSTIGVSIFRIIQEGCVNAIKYAKSEKIEVKLNCTQDKILLSITDNGCGFTYNPKDQPDRKNNKLNGFGLQMMRERVNLMSGEMKVDSAKNKGTCIYVEIPIDMEDKE